MACSCKKNSGRRSTTGVHNRSGIVRPTSRVPVSAQSVSAQSVSAQGFTPTSQRSSSGELQEKKRTQRIRRDAIRKALNK